MWREKFRPLVHSLFWDLFEDAVHMKEDWYFKLVAGAVEAGYSAETITVEVGSRGLPNIAGVNRLQISQKSGGDSLIELQN